MRFMMIIKANKDSEAGVLPSTEVIQQMMAYNEELVKAGVLLDAGGLQPSSAGFRVAWHGGQPTVTDGPFAETKELIAGFWIIQVKSREEAIEWAKRVPYGDAEVAGHIELRPFFEAPDLTERPELIQHKNELEARVEAYRQK